MKKALKIFIDYPALAFLCVYILELNLGIPYIASEPLYLQQQL